jgi:C4-dicarboxylate-specific signal transduction histidine kinase
VFAVQRPATPNEFDSLNDERYFVMVADAATGNRFKCTKLNSGNGGFLLVCNPLLNEMNTPVQFHLEVSDFAPHDIIAEYLFVMKANRLGMREANQLIEDMTRKNQELEQARRDLVMLNDRLEERAEQTTRKLRFAQTELEQGEKLAVLGRLAAGVAHEMNTPLGAITSSVNNVSELLRYLFKDGLGKADHDTVKAACTIADAFTVHQNLTSREERAQVLQLTELLRAEYGVGEEAVSHARTLVESGIMSTDRNILDHIYTAPDPQVALDTTTTIMKVRKSISTVEVAAQKAANVIRALKSYVRSSENLEDADVNLKKSIEDVLLLFANQLKMGVDVHLAVDPHLQLKCDQTELSKVWTNLISNAIYAMEGKGNIWIDGHRTDNAIALTFANDGPPIPKEVMDHLFEPFYSTKPVGEGSGMGLSIALNVVAALRGSMHVETGQQTLFKIILPTNSTE